MASVDNIRGKNQSLGRESEENVESLRAALRGADGELINPVPSEEQNMLWENIADRFTADLLERELAFMELKSAIRERLASQSFADDIERVSQKFSLDAKGIEKFARVIRDLFTGVLQKDQIPAISENVFAIEGDARENLASELRAIAGLEANIPPAPAIVESTPLETVMSKVYPPIDSIAGIPREAEAPAPTPVPPPVNAEARPFMLHEEEPAFTREEPKGGASVTFEPSPGVRPKAGQKPVTAKVEGPGGATRVVHY